MCAAYYKENHETGCPHTHIISFQDFCYLASMFRIWFILGNVKTTLKCCIYIGVNK